ncbi:hypothetical protein APR08_002552 [Nocardia amikacinitolerans]|nr:hypothetical protein [Nocardia amikacinitolerans]
MVEQCPQFRSAGNTVKTFTRQVWDPQTWSGPMSRSSFPPPRPTASSSVSEDVAMQFQGVDVVWVRQRLENFIETTKPVNQSSASVLTAHTRPQCGRAEAIRLGETIRPILDRLYPQ